MREAGVSLIDCEHRTPPAAATGFPYIAIPQLKRGTLDLSEVRRISPEHYFEWTRKAQPQEDDVILSRRCNPGETAVVPGDLKCALGQNLVLLRSDGTSIYPPFLRWLVRGQEWWDQIGTFLNVGAVFDSLKCADIPNFRLSMPPIEDQRAIATMLGALDNKIELNRRMNETLEAIARAIFKSWFVDFDPVRAKAEGRQPIGVSPKIAELFPFKFVGSPLGKTPLGWTVCTIGDVSRRVAMGPFGSDIKTDNFVETGVPVIRGGNLTNGFVDEGFVFLTEQKADELRNANAFPGDIVITHRGTLGQVGLIPRGCTFPRYVVSQSQMLISADPQRVTPYFLHQYLISERGQHELLANTSQTGVPAIARPTTSVKAIQVAVPPMQLLNEFESVAVSLSNLEANNTSQSRTLATLRDALLPKLLSGEIRLKQAEKAVEAAV